MAQAASDERRQPGDEIARLRRRETTDSGRLTSRTSKKQAKANQNLVSADISFVVGIVIFDFAVRVGAEAMLISGTQAEAVEIIGLTYCDAGRVRVAELEAGVGVAGKRIDLAPITDIDAGPDPGRKVASSAKAGDVVGDVRAGLALLHRAVVEAQVHADEGIPADIEVVAEANAVEDAVIFLVSTPNAIPTAMDFRTKTFG